MALSFGTKNALALALTSTPAANEIAAGLSGGGTPSAHVTPVAVTFTASAPANYATPVGTLTVASGATPTVVELLEYCDELRANIAAISAVLHAQGLTS